MNNYINKEKYVQVVEERDSFQRKLEDNQMELAKLQVSEPFPPPTMNNYINKLSCWYINQKKVCSSGR